MRAASIAFVAGFASFSEIRQRGYVAWIHEDLREVPLEEFWAKLEPMTKAKGRGGIGRLTIAGRELVVRPYRRGGAFGQLLNDRYSQPHRAKQELEVLHKLQQEGVPVVAPVAALAKKGRAFWRLRLCTELLADALTVPAFLDQYPDRRRQTSEAVGLVIRLAFAAGLRHPDLHLDNVLVRPSGDKVRAVLVDLDRARIDGPLTDRVRDGMLVRMQRHLVRHRRSLAALPSRSETMRFLRGLGFARGERADLWRSLMLKLERSMARRDWLRNR
jgi:3-deoxy-D-manno-octulosonic acid kinase